MCDGAATADSAVRHASIEKIARKLSQRFRDANMVGYAFAAQYQDRVARFVLMDAPLPGVGPWDEILKTGHGGPRQKSQTFQSLKSAIDEDRCLGMREHLKRLATQDDR